MRQFNMLLLLPQIMSSYLCLDSFVCRSPSMVVAEVVLRVFQMSSVSFAWMQWMTVAHHFHLMVLDVDDHDCGHDHDDHDAHGVHRDDDAGRISVTHFVDLRRLCVPNVRSMLSKRFDVVVPCHAHRGRTPIPQTSTMLMRKWAAAIVVWWCQFLGKMCESDWLEYWYSAVKCLGRNCKTITIWMDEWMNQQIFEVKSITWQM